MTDLPHPPDLDYLRRTVRDELQTQRATRNLDLTDAALDDLSDAIVSSIAELFTVKWSPLLQRLVDDRRFDDLINTVSLTEVAEAWLRYQHDHANEGPTMFPEADSNWWAVEAWMDPEWWADERRVRAGVLELVAAAETDLDFGMIGAAVMEVFITEDLDRLAWLEEQAAQSEQFRRAFANVHVWGKLPDEIVGRVETAAAIRLPRPRGWNGP